MPLASAGEAANGIANIAVVGSQMTVYLEDGTVLGPYTLPTAMIQYRGDWTAATAYVEMDLVTIPDAGVYLVLQDHTSDAAFDALAQDAESNPLYPFLFPMGASASVAVSDEGAQALASLTDINIAGAGVTVMDDGDGTVTVTIPGDDGGAAVSEEGAQILAAPTDLNFAGVLPDIPVESLGPLQIALRIEPQSADHRFEFMADQHFAHRLCFGGPGGIGCRCPDLHGGHRTVGSSHR